VYDRYIVPWPEGAALAVNVAPTSRAGHCIPLEACTCTSVSENSIPETRIGFVAELPHQAPPLLCSTTFELLNDQPSAEDSRLWQ